MYNCKLRKGLAKIKQNIIAVLTTANGLNGASEQEVSSRQFAMQLGNKFCLILGWNWPPGNTPLNLRWIELDMTNEQCELSE